MCGRFYIPADDAPEQLAELLQQAEARLQKADPAFRLPRGEVRPGDWAAVVSMSRAGTPAPFPMKWGYHVQPSLPKGVAGSGSASGQKLLINARSETAREKPTFRDSMVNRRCLIPAGAYFEWDHRVKPLAKYRFTLPDAPILWLAGLYRYEPESAWPVFTVLTRPAAEHVAPLHDRMPIILPPQLHSHWLDRSCPPEPLLAETLTGVTFRPAEQEMLSFLP